MLRGIWMLRGDIIAFAGVNRQVVKFRFAALFAWKMELPFPLSHGRCAAGGAGLPEQWLCSLANGMPLAEVARPIAASLQQLGDRDTLAETKIGCVLREASRKQACHQPRPAGVTGHARYVELREPSTFFRQLIKRRRLRIRMPVTAEVAVTKIIREHEYDVRRLVVG